MGLTDTVERAVKLATRVSNLGERDMTSDFKCPEGWEDLTSEGYSEAMFSLFPEFEYRVIRRPRNKPKPMPEIREGDAIYADYISGDEAVVLDVEATQVFTSSRKGQRLFILKEHIRKIYRDGDLIWERGV